MNLLFLCSSLQDKLLERLSMTHVIVALVLASLGLAIILLSKRIAICVRKQDKIPTSDNVYRGTMAFGIVMLLVSLLISVL